MARLQKFQGRVAACVVAASVLFVQHPALAADFEWPQKQFEREYYDTDIRVVLSKVLEGAGLQSNFRPGVQGNITANFRNMPLQAVFNKLMEEHNLQAAYEPSTKTMTIFAPQPGKLVALTHASPDHLRQAAQRLRIGGEIVTDSDNGIVLLRGSPEQLAQLEELAKRLDNVELGRRDDLQKRLSADSSRGIDEAKRSVAEAEATERRLQNEIRARLLDEVRNTETKVIPIRYANVGQATQTFQGQQVTIPGIDETLRTMLGLNDGKGGAGTPGSPAVAVNAQEQQELARIRRELGQVPPVVSVDPRSNSVIVRGTPSAIREVEQLVARLDRPLPLVEIEVMIVRARRGVAEELGVRWGSAQLLTNGDRNYGFGVSTGINQNNLASPSAATQTQVPQQSVSTGNGQTTVTDRGFTTLPAQPIDPFTLLPTSLGGTLAAFVYRGTNFSLQAQINALSEANKLQTIAAPRVVTLNNLTAKITNDRTQFLQVPPAPNAPGAYQEVKAGLVMNISPSLISREDTGEQSLIRLNINAADKDVTLSQGRPTLTGNEVQTQVVIPDGSTFVMGGLMNDSRIEAKDGVPGLQDIPLLGALFQSRRSLNDLEETIFFITPRVVQLSEAYARDIAERRYLETKRAALSEMRQDIQGRSQLLDIGSTSLEEDE